MQNKNIALVFPGQGSQYPAMGVELYNNFKEAKLVFDEVDDALNFKLSKIIFEGSEADLKKTENTQPALMAVSIATLKCIEALSGKKVEEFAGVLAGHSLGEYSALVAGGSISLRDASVMLRKRGEFMSNAFPTGGAMLAVIGVPSEEQITDLINASKGAMVLEIANDNSIGQVVLSGNEEAILKAQSLAKEFGAKMAVKLEVSGPFHSSLLSNASKQMREELEKYQISLPKVKVINNVYADYYQNEAEMKEILSKQIISRVRWRETMIKINQEGFTTAIEVGAGKVLCGLFKRTCKEVATLNAEKPNEIEEVIKLFS